MYYYSHYTDGKLKLSVLMNFPKVSDRSSIEPRTRVQTLLISVILTQHLKLFKVQENPEPKNLSSISFSS